MGKSWQGKLMGNTLLSVAGPRDAIEQLPEWMCVSTLTLLNFNIKITTVAEWGFILQLLSQLRVVLTSQWSWSRGLIVEGCPGKDRDDIHPIRMHDNVSVEGQTHQNSVYPFFSISLSQDQLNQLNQLKTAFNILQQKTKLFPLWVKARLRSRVAVALITTSDNNLLTLKRDLPLTMVSAVKPSRFWRWAKGLTAPQDSR